MDTAKLSAFIAAADTGSISQAARQLGAQLPTVSRQIADLEATLGAALLIRTGRGVRLTPAGVRYLERARRVVRELEAAAAEMRGQGGVALTQLRLSASVEVSLRLLPDALAQLTQRHPDLWLEVHSDTRLVSLVEEDYDVAIRVGALKNSELIARKLGAISLVPCANADVARSVRTASDLRAADFVLVAGTRSELVASLRGRSVRVQLKGTCRVSTFTEAGAFAAASNRLALLPSFTAAGFLADRRLVRVLPALALPRVDLHLLHPQRHRGSRVVEDLVVLLTAALDRAERSIGA